MKYEHEEVLNNFTAACEEVMNCKFIVAEIKIMKLLKCVAESLPIYNEIENALKDFNYEYEFQKCKIPNAEDRGLHPNRLSPCAYIWTPLSYSH